MTPLIKGLPTCCRYKITRSVSYTRSLALLRIQDPSHCCLYKSLALFCIQNPLHCCVYKSLALFRIQIPRTVSYTNPSHCCAYKIPALLYKDILNVELLSDPMQLECCGNGGIIEGRRQHKRLIVI